MRITNYKNRFIILLFAAVFLTLGAFAPAFAEGAVVLSISKVTISPNDVAEVAIEIANLENVSGMSFLINFDNTAFELSSADLTVEETPLKSKDTIGLTAKVSKNGKTITVIGVSTKTHNVNLKERTAIVTARFKPTKAVQLKEYPLSFSEIEVLIEDSNGKTVHLENTQKIGGITVTEKGAEPDKEEEDDEEKDGEETDNDNNSGDSGSGGSGGSGGSKYTPGIIVTLPDGQEPATGKDALGAGKFADLGGFEWAHESIDTLVKAGIIRGATETEYEPERSITRAEFCKLIAETFGFSETDELKSYTDVNADDWFYAVVTAASKAGIVGGYPEGDFKPNAQITREEMAVMLVRAFRAAGIETPEGEMTFADANEMGDWSVEFIASLAQMGIVSGRGDNKFVPGDNLTRAEAAKVVCSAYEILNNS